MEHHREMLKDRRYRKRRLEIEGWTRRYLAENADAGARSGYIIIPVVVHVVWRTTAENISVAQIQSQLTALNQDYRRLNADVAGTPAVFQPLVADARIQFQLAARDPNCNPTTGITRTSTTVTQFARAGDPVKFAASGGIAAWPADRYLNIWVCRLAPTATGQLLGYSSFPGDPAASDGVVIDHRFFGTTGTAAGSAPFNLGRTATHEIGHWLNLLHIWGDDGLACTGSDQVADTPNQADLTTGCPTFPQVSCGNGPNGDMFMNYMDYTDDACMFMFTVGQAARMDATLYGPRASILASEAIVPPAGVPGADLWAQDRPEDVGAEPDTAATVMWDSEDIWVRRQNDGTTNQEHQNPEYRVPGSSPNYVYVRVRNRGCGAPASGTLKLYWAKASSGLSWPSPWDGSVTTPALMGGQVGSQATGSIPAEGSAILAFPWSPPNPADYSSFGFDAGHFCLLTRIETAATAPFGMAIPETSDLYGNVRNNNNIVWKNVEVVDELPSGDRTAAAAVSNFGKAPKQTRLVFAAPDRARGKSVFDFGVVEVDLGARLFERWLKGGKRGGGFTLVKRRLRLVKSGAWIGGIALRPGEIFPLRLHFRPRKGAQRSDVFSLDLAQYAGDKRPRIVGGQTFVLKTVVRVRKEQGRRATLEFDGCEWVKR